jgi:putative YhdH/YhfP family quinone oxidoreductase
MSPFKAYLIDEKEGQTGGAFVEMEEADLDQGEVTIKVAYSSVNYKDALAATGAGRIIRRFPCVGGIDLSGTVIESSDARFQAGDLVIATSFDIGVAHHGGYAEIARVPAAWVVPLPAGLSLFEAMALGTAGFTAALGIVRMEENGLHPRNGPIVVSGATGGVGSLAVDILAKLGYQVTALTGKENETDYLKELGATEVMLRSALDLSRVRALDRALWAGAVDNLGDAVPGPVKLPQRGGCIEPVQEGFELGMVRAVILRVDLPDQGPARPQGAHQRVLAADEIQVAGPQQVVVVDLGERREV